jgi:hypothetical protein
VITISVNPKIAVMIIKILVLSGMTIIEAVDEAHNRTGISKSFLKKLIN